MRSFWNVLLQFFNVFLVLVVMVLYNGKTPLPFPEFFSLFSLWGHITHQTKKKLKSSSLYRLTLTLVLGVVLNSSFFLLCLT